MNRSRGVLGVVSCDDYERILLDAVPVGCERALDVGCGHGRFARRLAERVREVEALDRVDLGVTGPPNLRFILGDFLARPVEVERYDFISAVASLHHLPFEEALERMRRALKPGGRLGIIGLFRDAGAIDFMWSAAAFPVNRALRLRRRRRENLAPLREPRMTLDQIREGATRLLPGARIKRHLLWRYSLLWTR
jgi:SAM-dependent methyltransferase